MAASLGKMPTTSVRRLISPFTIEGDADIEAFILVRIETLTSEHITDAIKADFPPARHVGRSAVHRSW